MDKKPYLVGITGGSASGKTHFLNSLKEKYPSTQVCFISQDDYYKPIEHQNKDQNGEVNYDLPDAIDLQHFHTDLMTLAAGKPLQKLSYNFNNPNAPRELMDFYPAPILIIEGLFIFYYEDIFNLLDLKIFIDADEDIKLQRRLQRDTVERGISHTMVTYQWFNHVKPAFQKFLLPYKELADLVIINNSHFGNSIKVIESHFNTLLTEGNTH